MYTSVSNDFLKVLARPSRHFAARFKDNGTEIELAIKNMSVTTGTCGGTTMAVGVAYAGYIDVTAKRIDTPLEGKELSLEIGLLMDDNSYEYVPFGYWTVQKPMKSNDMMTFQAVDRMAGKLHENYTTALTYPATVASVLSELATNCGLTINCNLQTSTVMIPVAIEGVTQRGALAIIAATLLANAWVDRNGEVQITALSGTPSVQINYDYVKPQPEMDEDLTEITGVKVYTVTGQTDTYIERGSGNQVEVSDVYMTSDNLDIVKNNVMGMTYGGGQISFMGNPLIDPSDRLWFRGSTDMQEYMLVTHLGAEIITSGNDNIGAYDYRSYDVPCMEIVQYFDGGLLTTVSAPGQFEVTESTYTVGAVTEELQRQAKSIVEVQEVAEQADTNASAAVSLANGKNKLYYQDHTTVTGMSEGDMCYELGQNGAITALYEYKKTGSNPDTYAWTLRQLGQGSILANSITSNEIYGNTLSAIFADLGNVNVGGSGNGSGVLTVKDASDNTVGIWDNAGITLSKGTIKSSTYQSSVGNYSAAGMIIDLDASVIKMPNTAILSDGSLYTKSGNIAGWQIDSEKIYSSKTISGTTYRANMQSMTGTDTARLAFFVALDANGTTTYPFRVNYAGKLFTTNIEASGGTVGPWTIGSTGLYNTLTSMSDTSHDGAYIGTDGLKIVAGSQTVSNTITANSTWSYIESANEVVGIRMIAWPDGSTGLYEYDAVGGNLSALWLRSGTTVSTEFNVTAAADVDSYVTLWKDGTISLSKPNAGGKIEFCYNGTIPATSSIQETASGVLSASGRFTASAFGSNGRTGYSDGAQGVYVTSDGAISLCKTSGGGTLAFMYNGATSATSSIAESASGTLTITASNGVKSLSIYNKTTSSTANVNIDNTGLMQRCTTSSRRYKTDIQPIEDYKSVLDIPVVTFKYKTDYLSKVDQRYGQDVPGFIAEDVNKYYPIAAEWVGAKVEDWNVRFILPPMLAVEQDHEKRIAELEEEIRRLKGEL